MLVTGGHLGVGILAGVAIVAGAYLIGAKNGRVACIKEQVEYSYQLYRTAQKTADTQAEAIRRRVDELQSKNAEFDRLAQTGDDANTSCLSADRLHRINSIQ